MRFLTVHRTHSRSPTMELEPPISSLSSLPNSSRPNYKTSDRALREGDRSAFPVKKEANQSNSSSAVTMRAGRFNFRGIINHWIASPNSVLESPVILLWQQVLVTGASGFIGGRLVERLISMTGRVSAARSVVLVEPRA